MSFFEKKYILYADKKKYTEKQLMKGVYDNAVPGILIHKLVNQFYDELLNIEERALVADFYRKNTDTNYPDITYNYLDYVPFLQAVGGNLLTYLHGIWQPLIPYNIYRCEFIVNEIILSLNVKGYELATLHQGLALLTYKRCEKNTKVLEFVARHGLIAYELRDTYFKQDNCVKLDFFWSTLCNVLKELKMYDKAIEIATFALENDAYDKTKGGWSARLERLIYQKNKDK